LQTADYARALFQEGGLEDPARIEGCVQIRTGRNAVLDRPKPPRTLFFVHEHALRMPVGGPRVMNEQLLHLLFLGERLQCAIRVVPNSAGSRGMTLGSFHIFRYKNDPPLVCVQHETTTEFWRPRMRWSSYRGIVNRVDSVALDGAQSRTLLAELASSYERQEEARYADDRRGLAQEQL
jgi:hypothetical protein